MAILSVPLPLGPQKPVSFSGQLTKLLVGSILWMMQIDLNGIVARLLPT